MSCLQVTDLSLTHNFLVNSRGFTLADTTAVTWSFDSATNKVTADVIVAAGSVADNAITNVKLADMVQATIKGRAASAGTGDPVDLTASQVKTILALTSADISDFTEAAQDATGALIQTSTTITPSYNDAGNALTLAVNLAANYTWAGTHVFAAGTQTQLTSSATNFNPLAFFATGQAANNRAWTFRFGGSADLLLYAADDTGAPVAAGIALDLKRSGTSISEIDFGNATANPTFFFLGTGLVTVGGDLKVVGKSGFNNTAPIAKPTVTGSRGANAALTSLLTALANYGLLTDSST